MRAMPLSSMAWSTSLSTTGRPENEITCAISAPMAPAPTTAALKMYMPALLMPVHRLDDQRAALAACGAQGGQPVAGGRLAFGVAPPHLVHQGDDNAAARRTHGVAQGDGAAVDVDTLPVPGLVLERLAHRQHLRGEGLVDLHQVHIGQLEIGAAQCLGDRDGG